MAHPNRNKREAREEKERREWYENLTLGTAIVGVAVISISTVVTAWMGWIMVQQLRVMESQQRPWLSVAPGEVRELRFHDDGTASMYVGVNVENEGQAPATGIELHAKMVASGPNFGVNEILTQQRATCDLGASVASFSEVSHTLFPGQKKTITEISYVEKVDIAKALPKEKAPPKVTSAQEPAPRVVELLVVGCVTYKYYVSDTPRRTLFAYMVLTKLDEKSYPDDLIEIGRDVPANLIVLRPYPAGNHFAN